MITVSVRLEFTVSEPLTTATPSIVNVSCKAQITHTVPSRVTG